MSNPKTAVIIAAAGQGKRFGGDVSKQFALLCGKPIVAYSIRSFAKSPLLDEIVLVVPDDGIAYCRNEIVDKFQFEKVVKIVPGSETRQDSVENGLNSLSQDIDIAIVHDAARPFVNTQMIEAVITEASQSGGAIAAVRVKDTVKKSTSENYIEATVPRESLWLAQTPQAFRYNLLKKAFAKAREDGFTGTDEASLVERIGVDVKLIAGSELNMKITTQADFSLGEMILRERNLCSE